MPDWPDLPLNYDDLDFEHLGDLDLDDDEDEMEKDLAYDPVPGKLIKRGHITWNKQDETEDDE